MDGMTTMHEKLRRARRAQPFVPFMIVLENGEKLPVVQPLSFGFSQEEVNVWVPKRGLIRFPLRIIKSIEDSNGHAA
jgi:hypothetical protein